ncbi:hypothetical protein LguiB_004276 [Lonicera macranthoides]
MDRILIFGHPFTPLGIATLSTNSKSQSDFCSLSMPYETRTSRLRKRPQKSINKILLEMDPFLAQKTFSTATFQINVGDTFHVLVVQTRPA